MNDVQLSVYQKNIEKQKSRLKEKRKEVKCNFFVKPSKEEPYVDYNFLNALFKLISQKDYRSLQGNQVNR